jgi:hypothetical protein
MTEKYSLLYNDLLADMARCNAKDLCDEVEKVSDCYWIAFNYWERLKKLISPAKFSTEAEEIEFFREVKPQFTCHIEYYTILSQALVCARALVVAKDEFCFWEEEINRYKRFCDKNESFVTYYESGKHYSDVLFFLREHTSPGYVPKAVIYDDDPEYCTSHDGIVRSYLAQKMYWEYCKKRRAVVAGRLEKRIK